MLLKAIGQRVAQAREKAKLTQAELGEKIGKPQQWVQRFESNNIKLLNLEVVLDIAKHTGVSGAWLIFGEDELRRVSKEGMSVALHYDRLPLETRHQLLALIAESIAGSYGKESQPDTDAHMMT